MQAKFNCSNYIKCNARSLNSFSSCIIIWVFVFVYDRRMCLFLLSIFSKLCLQLILMSAINSTTFPKINAFSSSHSFQHKLYIDRHAHCLICAQFCCMGHIGAPAWLYYTDIIIPWSICRNEVNSYNYGIYIKKIMFYCML